METCHHEDRHHSEIRDWLIKNGYKELGLFTFALRNMDDARMWLVENGSPHLLELSGIGPASVLHQAGMCMRNISIAINNHCAGHSRYII